GRPVQQTAEPFDVELELVDLAALEPAARERVADELRARLAADPFDVTRLPLVRWALVRLRPDEHLLVQVEHHFVHDGWSLATLLREVRDLYAAFASGRPSPLPELEVQLADFAAWQRAWVERGALDGQVEFW